MIFIVRIKYISTLTPHKNSVFIGLLIEIKKFLTLVKDSNYISKFTFYALGFKPKKYHTTFPLKMEFK